MGEPKLGERGKKVRAEGGGVGVVGGESRGVLEYFFGAPSALFLYEREGDLGLEGCGGPTPAETVPGVKGWVGAQV